jgi:hypothetical protein
MAGLDPAIHLVLCDSVRAKLDPRVKPGDDTCGCGASIADSNFKQPLLFRHASSPPLFAARGRRRPLHSHPLARGRAERRVPVAPLGLMRCGLPQFRVHQDFRRRRASARRSAYGVFSVACTSAMANGPITKINVPGRRDRVAAKHLAERVSIWSSVTPSRESFHPKVGRLLASGSAGADPSCPKTDVTREPRNAASPASTASHPANVTIAIAPLGGAGRRGI